MAMKQKNFTPSDLESLDVVTFTNVAVIYSKVIDEYMKLNTSLIDGNVELTKGGVKVDEVEDGAVDNASSIGKFAIGSDNRLKLIVDKAVVNTVDLAKSELSKCVAVYKLRDNLMYEEDIFEVNLINEANGNRIFNTVLLSGEKTLAYIKNNVSNIDLNATDCIKFEIIPKLK